MIPSDARVWIAMGHTDMRKGMQGLALLVQQIANNLHDDSASEEGTNEFPDLESVGAIFERSLVGRIHARDQIAALLVIQDAIVRYYLLSPWCTLDFQHYTICDSCLVEELSRLSRSSASRAAEIMQCCKSRSIDTRQGKEVYGSTCSRVNFPYI